MIIYKITNTINQKVYIGQYSGKRFDLYFGSGKILKLAIKKYGKENFQKEILEYCETKALLNEREKFWIAELNSNNPEVGYNITLGGTGGNLGDEWLILVKNGVRKGEHHPLYGKSNLSRLGKASWNKGLTKETDIRLLEFSNNLLGRTFTDEHRKNLSKAKQGCEPWNKGKTGVQKAWNKGIERPKKKCPYCDKEGGDGMMQRWHFDNCKFKQ